MINSKKKKEKSPLNSFKTLVGSSLDFEAFLGIRLYVDMWFFFFFLIGFN